jgi:RHS repeat-associated protein
MRFYQGTTLLGEDLSPPYSFTWQSVPVGNYSLSARAVDALELEHASTPVNVTVTAASSPAQLHFIHVDHLNTPRLVANAAGTTVWRWDQWEPFGDNLPNENPSSLGAFEFPLRLPGQYFDKETNVHYNYFRDYDASIGRYVESDPIGLLGGLNTYAYVGSSPLTTSDPKGLRPLVITEACPPSPDGYTFERYEIVPIRQQPCIVVIERARPPRLVCDKHPDAPYGPFSCQKTCYYVKTFCGIVYSRISIRVKCDVTDGDSL